MYRQCQVSWSPEIFYYHCIFECHHRYGALGSTLPWRWACVHIPAFLLARPACAGCVPARVPAEAYPSAKGFGRGACGRDRGTLSAEAPPRGPSRSGPPAAAATAPVRSPQGRRAGGAGSAGAEAERIGTTSSLCAAATTRPGSRGGRGTASGASASALRPRPRRRPRGPAGASAGPPPSGSSAGGASTTTSGPRTSTRCTSSWSTTGTSTSGSWGRAHSRRGPGPRTPPSPTGARNPRAPSPSDARVDGRAGAWGVVPAGARGPEPLPAPSRSGVERGSPASTHDRAPESLAGAPETRSGRLEERGGEERRLRVGVSPQA